MDLKKADECHRLWKTARRITTRPAASMKPGDVNELILDILKNDKVVRAKLRELIKEYKMRVADRENEHRQYRLDL